MTYAERWDRDSGIRIRYGQGGSRFEAEILELGYRVIDALWDLGGLLHVEEDAA